MFPGNGENPEASATAACSAVQPPTATRAARRAADGATISTYLSNVDVKMNPKMDDFEEDFAHTLRSRVESSAGQRISPNNADPSEIGGFKDKF